jgi:cellulose biosynthesis protein BcsQ
MKIVFANAKGGPGKTTSSIYTAEYMSREMGIKTVLLDLDHQCNASSYYHELDGIEIGNILTFLEKKTAFYECCREIHDNLWLMPGSMRMLRYDSIFSDVTGKELLLSSMLDRFINQFDSWVIDTHPDMSTIQKSALLMADIVVAPIVAGDRWNLEGLDLLLNEIQELSEGALQGFMSIQRVYALPTMIQRFSVSDWKELKTIQSAFPECHVLPGIKYYANTKRVLSNRDFKKSGIYQDYGKVMEEIWK